MNTAIEDRLRRHYAERTEHLPDVGPGLGADSLHDLELSSSASRSARRGSNTLLLAAAVAIVVVAGLVALSRRSDDMSDNAADQTSAPAAADDNALEPATTLPDFDDVHTSPVTVAGNAPTTWFRVAPDLDVAWYTPTDGSSPSMLCWRTPAGDDCQPDDTPALLVVPTGGGQTLVIASGARSLEVQIQLDDGTGLSAPVVTTQSIIDLGVARFELPDGRSIVSSQVAAPGSSMSGDPEPVEVTGATLPASGDLIEVPMTVPTNSPLVYWRFLPDLDFSERQTSAGSGTELCWRTPAGTGCIDDTFYSPDVGVIPTDGAAILLARPAVTPIEPVPTDPMSPTLEIGPPPMTATVTLSDGTKHVVPLTQGERYGVAYGRIDLSAGTTVRSATSK